MDRQPVTSSNLVSVGYDPEKKTLEVEFRGGSVYQYAGVSPEEHTALLLAPSLGKHLYAYIKSRYPATRVDMPASDSVFAPSVSKRLDEPGEAR